MSVNLVEKRAPRRSKGGARVDVSLASSALRTHVSYVAGPAATAVIRSATWDDKLAIARLVLGEAASDTPAPQRRQRVQAALAALRDRQTVIHVADLNRRLCGMVILRVASSSRMFASETLVSESGLAFNPGLALKMAEHAVRCCQSDGWSALRYFADPKSTVKFYRHFRRLGYPCAVEEARIGLGDWLRHGRRSHALRFELRKGRRGSDESDPRIVWF